MPSADAGAADSVCSLPACGGGVGRGVVLCSECAAPSFTTRAPAEVVRLWGARLGTPAGDRLDALAALIDACEAAHDPTALKPPAGVFHRRTVDAAQVRKICDRKDICAGEASKDAQCRDRARNCRKHAGGGPANSDPGSGGWWAPRPH